MAYECTDHPEVRANLLITNLDTGDTITLCQDCIYPWAAAMAAAFAPADEVPAVPAAVDEHTGDEDDEDGDQVTAPLPDPSPAVTPGTGEGENIEPDEEGDDPGFSESTMARALADPTGTDRWPGNRPGRGRPPA